MDWSVSLLRGARKALNKVPQRDRLFLASAIEDMTADPFTGDVRRLKGEWAGYLRRRVGDWRLIFTIDAAERTVIVAYIERRSTTTYR